IQPILFFVIYIIVFTILTSSERKIIYPTTLPIPLFISLIFPSIFFTPPIPIILPLIFRVIAPLISHFLNTKNPTHTSSLLLSHSF
ncbi:hypothetical protein, partial [Staphylococcus epidermidis]|uniref:hypothetical protein n=1 Tax=Staphylococcus epidermidis TaxID=1282 RepID=UPI0011A1B096